MGNHRDAWIFGAIDPSSGTAAMLEMARAFGRMREKHGKKDQSMGSLLKMVLDGSVSG